jgi:hypothetical protein
MPRIPVHTLDTAPGASREILDVVLKGPGRLGRILNLQAQMAHAPVVLAAYAALRKSIEEHATLDFKARTAIQLTVSAVDGSAYSAAINSMLGARAGWAADDIDALRAGTYNADPRLAALLAVVGAAAGHAGHVDDLIVRPMTKIFNPLMLRMAGGRLMKGAAQIHHVGRHSAHPYVTSPAPGWPTARSSSRSPSATDPTGAAACRPPVGAASVGTPRTTRWRRQSCLTEPHFDGQ